MSTELEASRVREKRGMRIAAVMVLIGSVAFAFWWLSY